MARAFLAASTEYLSVASAPVTAAPLTMACWFNANDVTTNYTLMGVGDSASLERFNMLVRGAVGGDPLSFRAQDSGGGTNADTSSGYSANTWHHGCAVAVSSTDRTVYLDGGNAGTSAVAHTPASIDRTVLAATAHSTITQHFDGELAEAAIWNAALDADEAAALGAGFSPLLIRPQSLVFYVPLVRDDDNDLIGGLSLTANGTPTVDPHPRVYYPDMPSVAVPAAGGRILGALAGHGGLAGAGGIAGRRGGLAG